ncbi:hypothetical protein LPUS_05300 [Lasallia pustulata]|uniref:Uncharacterized protein n=1 Tax=Lasallia pustulata TaxID=136370 RepID=A0A1W5CYF7_9LECA|nr:hypothetical protein LPUS_05300 [Lasallia pustulata]
MTVNRTRDQAGPATLTVFFAPAPSESTSAATAPEEHVPAERAVAVDVKHMHEGEILARLMEVTGAVAVVATKEEEEELRMVGEERGRSEKDKERTAEVKENRRRRESLLALARGGREEARA